MVRENDRNIHFHIRWSRKERLDWEGFDTRHEAMARALELADPGEEYTIEEATETCSICGQRLLRRTE